MTHHFQGKAAFLPLDVLERIFFHAQPGPHEVSTALSVLKYAPGNVSQVCRPWRRVALDRHKLWTSVEIVADVRSVGRLEKGVKLVETYISRSGTVLPLDVAVFAETEGDPDDTEYLSANLRLAVMSMHQYMGLIIPVRHRLRYLELFLPTDGPRVIDAPIPGAWPWTLNNMPNLESLTVAYPPIGNSSEAGTIDLSACSTRIRKCSIYGCIKVCLAEGLVLENLVYLSFDLVRSRDSTLVASWYGILQRTTRLTELAVVIREGLDWTHRPIQPRGLSIHLPHLHTLHVHYPAAVEDQSPLAPYRFLDGLRCPLLKDLALLCTYPDAPILRDPFDADIASFEPYQFLHEHGVRLERLVIGHDLFYENELQFALTLCTNLRALHFYGMRFADDSEILKVLHLQYVTEELDEHGYAPYCPQLRCLRVTNCYIPPTTTTTAGVVDMIVGLRAREGPRLDYFEFEGCNLKGFNEDPRILAIRDELKEESNDKNGSERIM